MDKRRTTDRLLRLTLALLKRIDPAITGLHVVRLETLGKGATALQMFTDECVPPDTGYVGTFTDGLTGVRSIDMLPKARAHIENV